MKKNIKDFINSNLDEADYFNLSKENLINLKEYVLSLNKKDKIFKELIEEPKKSIQKKCDWVQDIGFNALQFQPTKEYIQSSIWLFPTNGHELIVKNNSKTGQFKSISEQIPRIYLISNKNRVFAQRQKEIKNIQDELHEIEIIGKTLYDGLLYPRESISGSFNINYTPNISLSIWNNIDEDLLAIFQYQNIKTYNKPQIKDDEKDKLLTKIQIKKG